MKPRPIQTDALVSSTSPRKYVHALRAAVRSAARIAAWNALFIVAPLLLIALAGEAYFRLTRPFINTSAPSRFVDGVGIIREPNAELHYANWDDDNFVVSRANSLGFLDREPISPERAAESCHIAFIGDSFVEAMEAPIADKFHVRLEEMAARELPHLAIATQAYGITNTGQINQIPFYDEYARRLNPKLVVLSFHLNDFSDNSPAMQALRYGVDPDRMPFMSVQRDERGTLKLALPDPEYWRFALPKSPEAWHERARKKLVRISYFAKWLDMKGWVDGGIEAIRARISAPVGPDPQLMAWMRIIAERPCCASLLDGWQPAGSYSVHQQFKEENLPPAFQEALEYTAFGIDQFKRRVDRDHARLAILSVTASMGTRGDPEFDRLNAITEARGIPIINLYDYKVSQGHDTWDGHLRYDGHWNATGHQWAAEAVLEWLEENQDVCG